MQTRMMTIAWIAMLAAIPAMPALIHAQMPSPQSPAAKSWVCRNWTTERGYGEGIGGQTGTLENWNLS
jgi:hypothetical protein